MADKTHFPQLKTLDFLFTLYYSTIGIRENRENWTFRGLEREIISKERKMKAF